MVKVLAFGLPSLTLAFPLRSGLVFTKRDHPFPKGAPDAPTQAQALAASYNATPTAKQPSTASPDAATSTHTPADSSAAPASDEGTVVDGPPLQPSTSSKPKTTSSKKLPKGHETEAHNKKVFEDEKAEDDRRRKKAEAEGWTAETIERTFGDRYAQVCWLSGCAQRLGSEMLTRSVRPIPCRSSTVSQPILPTAQHPQTPTPHQLLLPSGRISNQAAYPTTRPTTTFPWRLDRSRSSTARCSPTRSTRGTTRPEMPSRGRTTSSGRKSKSRRSG